MSQSLADPAARPASEPAFLEFVLIIALMMGLISLSIDNLLPAFEPIRSDLGVADANRMQLILTAYMGGFAVMQLVYGPLSDMIGRRPILLIGLFVYTAGTLLAIFAHSFEVLLVARTIQGLGGAAARVLAVAIVRDRFAGRDMARVMSLVFMIFIIVPVIAPATGTFFLMLGSWRLIFISMLSLVLVVLVWFGLRMPETLHPENRMAFALRPIGAGIRRTATERAAIGNATAMGLTMGCLMTYLGQAQQIFETDIYKLGNWFALVFAIIAICMGLANFANASLVRRLGMRRMAHFGILGFTSMAAVLLLLAFLFDGRPPLLLFGGVLAGAHFLLSLTMPNFNSLSMEPLGDIAGTASSFIGCYTTIMGAVIGMLIGQAFDGTIFPLAFGYLGLGILCVGVVTWTERGRLFTAHAQPAA